jgi:hypothetical protein
VTLLKIPFRRLWEWLFLLMLKHCQTFKRDLRIHIWWVCRLEYTECHCGDLGAKYLFVAKERKRWLLSVLISTNLQWCIFPLYFCLWKQGNSKGSVVAISTHCCQILLVLCILAQHRIVFPDSCLTVWAV